MRKVVTAAAATILLVLTGVSATAEHKTVRHVDPHGDAYIDVWSTRKVKIHRQPQRIRFTLYSEAWGPDWEISVYVDSRGGPRADFRLWNYESLGESDCGGNRHLGGEIDDLRCAQDVMCCTTGTMWWEAPRASFNPTKPIRWRVRTHYPGATDDSEDDLAPDSGWYP